jgi:peptide/nickel transport system substrate-binding protein
MNETRRSLDSVGPLLSTQLHRRGLLRAAAGAGVAIPALDLSRLAAAQEGQPGGTAVVVCAANPASWDFTKTTWPTFEALVFMYDRLLDLNDAEELQPKLVTEWEISEDGLEYALTLREGVTFHDGTPFNAEAVKFNIERQLAIPDSANYADYEPVERIDVVDDLHVNIILKGVRPDFAYLGLAQWGAAQISPTAYEELGDDYSKAPVGTGPFKFDSYVPGSLIRFVRNDDYWGGAPLLDAVEVKIIPEPNVQLVEIESGAADAVIVTDPQHVARLEDAGLTVVSVITADTVFISFNVSQPPTNELAVRKAIAHAIDRDAIIESVLFGYAEKARGGVTTTSPFFDESVPMVEYDLEEAGRLLDEAGWVMGADGVRERDGQKLTLNQISTDFENWGLFNQIIQEQLLALGINCEISTLEWNSYLDQWRENQGGWNITYHQQGTQVAATEAIEAGWQPDAYWTITQIDDATDPDLVAARDELLAIWDEWQVTLDPERRQELATQAQTIYQDNQLAVWLWHRAYIHAFQPRLQGYRLTHTGRIVELDKAWIEA